MTTKFVGLLTVLVLVLSACGSSGTAGGPTEGIGVHGAWTIDIINADGTLDQHVEFENDLRASGAELLARLLTNTVLDVTENFHTLDWGLILADRGTLDNPGLSPCTTPVDDGFSSSAFVEQVCLLYMDDRYFSYLNALSSGTYLPSSGSLGVASVPGVVELSGSFVAEQQGTIDWVESLVVVETAPPETGLPPVVHGVIYPFTGTGLVPVEVEAGQVVQVQVDISFGTLTP